MPERQPSEQVRLLVSDVDGTLVTSDKRLTARTIEMVERLRDAGIAFAAVSSRPPRGMTMLLEPLGITSPMAGFNGGELVRPDLTPIEQHHVPRTAVLTALAALDRAGVDTWVFAGGEWLVTNLAGHNVAREQRAVKFAPRLVDDFSPYLDQVGKVVGSSNEFDLLKRVESELQRQLGRSAAANRSQQYYLDITNIDANKGTAARSLASRLGIPLTQTACIGDMTNDIPMLSIAGLAIAMGNGPAEVKAHAHEVTGGNDAEGFADAVERFILPRAPKE